MRGRVTQFDEARGLGTITAADGTDLPFHCTALLDGTRSVAVDTAVDYEVRAGGLGRWEATRIASAQG
jgi:cold shock CspA family protein